MPERPTQGGTALPLVSLTTSPDFLIESKGTVSAHVFNVTRGPLSEGGLTLKTKLWQLLIELAQLPSPLTCLPQ